MIRAVVIGAGGYGGSGILELLMGHPEAAIAGVVDQVGIGHEISELHPHLAGHLDLTIRGDLEEIRADVAFLATPDGVGQVLAPRLLKRDIRVIDFSGDFRFAGRADYKAYARRLKRDGEHGCPDLLSEAVYGLPELHREKIRKARVVGNPGCFAVACILGMQPAIRDKLVDPKHLIFDAKTGVSGAGRKERPQFHYPARYENVNAYRLSGHQHVMEIEQQLGKLGRAKVTISFVPQVVPTCRGIIACGYGRLKPRVTAGQVIQSYLKAYKREPFVDVFTADEEVGTNRVRGSNRVAVTVHVDPRTRTLIAISHLDNLMKGQAGSALQNMNVMFGLPETMGLDRPGLYP